MKRFALFLPVFLLFLSGSCQTQPAAPTLNFSYSPPPLDLSGGAAAGFAADIAYDTAARTAFDIFLPKNAAKPVPLVLFIHGGGFVRGDKTNPYKNPQRAADIRTLLENGIAFASANYRLLLPGDPDGVLKCLNDCKRCLQFIRLHAAELGIDPERIAIYGFSAGAGAGLWLGCHDDMRDSASADQVLRQSTRVRAVAARETQATYDLRGWAGDVFAEFPDLRLREIIDMAGGPAALAAFYGLSDPAGFDTPAVQQYRARVDLLGFIDAGDARLWLENDNPAEQPANRQQLFHHPFHARALKNRADAAGLFARAHIPALGIQDAPGENCLSFLLQQLQ